MTRRLRLSMRLKRSCLAITIAARFEARCQANQLEFVGYWRLYSAMRFGCNEDGVVCQSDTQERARHRVAIETRRTRGPISSAATGTRGNATRSKGKKEQEKHVLLSSYIVDLIVYL